MCFPVDSWVQIKPMRYVISAAGGPTPYYDTAPRYLVDSYNPEDDAYWVKAPFRWVRNREQTEVVCWSPHYIAARNLVQCAPPAAV